MPIALRVIDAMIRTILGGRSPFLFSIISIIYIGLGFTRIYATEGSTKKL